MNSETTNDVTERLSALPDLQPPADAWQRIRTRVQRDRRRIAWPVTAVAAAAALSGVAFLVRPVQQMEPAPNVSVESLVVQDGRAAASASSDVRTLQRRSRQIERMLQGLPPPAQIVRADTEGAIVELEDRIAAVDYELNMAALKRATEAAVSPGRLLEGGPQRSRVLWQRRVELMDQLLRVRYVEAGATPF